MPEGYEESVVEDGMAISRGSSRCMSKRRSTQRPKSKRDQDNLPVKKAAQNHLVAKDSDMSDSAVEANSKVRRGRVGASIGCLLGFAILWKPLMSACLGGSGLVLGVVSVIAYTLYAVGVLWDERRYSEGRKIAGDRSKKGKAAAERLPVARGEKSSCVKDDGRLGVLLREYDLLFASQSAKTSRFTRMIIVLVSAIGAISVQATAAPTVAPVVYVLFPFAVILWAFYMVFTVLQLMYVRKLRLRVADRINTLCGEELLSHEMVSTDWSTLEGENLPVEFKLGLGLFVLLPVVMPTVFCAARAIAYLGSVANQISYVVGLIVCGLGLVPAMWVLGKRLVRRKFAELALRDENTGQLKALPKDS